MTTAIASVARREIFVPLGDKVRKKSLRVANAMALELLNYGIVPDDDIVYRVSTHKRRQAMQIADSVLKGYTIGQLNPPLFPNWEQRRAFTFSEFVCQIFGYAVQLSGNDFDNEAFMADLRSRVVFDSAKTLSLASDESAIETFKSLVGSEVALDKDQQRNLFTLAEFYFDHAPDEIKSAEARIAVIMGRTHCLGSGSVLMQLNRFDCQPVDVLRYAAAERSCDLVKLPADVKYANLTWKARCELLTFLNRFDTEELCEAMSNNQTAWRRFFRHFKVLKQSDFINRFTNVVASALISLGKNISSVSNPQIALFLEKNRSIYEITETGNLVYRSYASRLQSAVDDKDMDAFEVLARRRPGHLFRNLGSLSHVCKKSTQIRFVDIIRSLIGKANASVLISLIQIDVAAKFRVIDSKGNTTVKPANYHPVISEVQGMAEREIYRRFGFTGQVQVANSLKEKVVPFAATNADLDRGTRIPFKKEKYLYSFVHWVESVETRTDLDLSFVAADENWSNLERINFTRQANAFMTHSGDFTSAPAPAGATEYGCIRIDDVPDWVRYIVPFINVYCGSLFSENNTAYAGFMFSKESQFGIKRKHTRYDLSQPARANVPYVMDVKNREIIIVDFNNRNPAGITIDQSIQEIQNLVSAVESKRVLTIGRFAEILSGDGDDVALKIKKTADADNPVEITPERLQELVS